MSSLRLAAAFCDGMVLQQGTVTKLFGFSKTEARVTVELERFPAEIHQPTDAETHYGLIFKEEDTSGRDGYFEFHLPPQKASYDSYRLTLRSGAEILVVDDILVGELWYAAGQDNMAQTVNDSDVQELLSDCVNLTSVRFYQMNEDGLSDQVPEYSYTPLGEAQGGEWQRGDQVYLMGDMSAIAFSFARELYYMLDVPIGVINVSSPGTYIHAWLPREIIEADPIIKNHVREVRLYRDQANWNGEFVEEASQDREEIASHQSMFPRPQTAALLEGRRPDRQGPIPLVVPRAVVRKAKVIQDIIPLEREFSPRNQPSAIFNHKVAPFVGLTIRGVLWMQGESDVDSPEYYLRAFRHFIDTLNELFLPAGDELALVISQLPPYLYNGLNAFGLASFNEMLAHACHILPVNAGLITLYDLSPDFMSAEHYCAALTPFAKREVGRRMAIAARGLVLGGDFSKGAPAPVAMERIGNKWMIDLTPQAVRGHGLRLKPGDTVLKGFAVCDSSRRFVKAEARILYGVRVLVWHDHIEDPESITYAFSAFNGDANLIGADGIPVLPFRVDLEPSRYLVPMPWSDCDQIDHFSWKEPLVRDVPRAKKKDWPGENALWAVTRGRGELSLTEEVMGYSSADLLLSYQSANERPVEIDAAIGHASAFPPLDFSIYREIELLVLNPDHHEKSIQLLLEDANGVIFESRPRRIEDAFRQQSIIWGEGELANDTSRITRLAFRLTDPGARGSLVFIRVNLLYQPMMEIEEG